MIFAKKAKVNKGGVKGQLASLVQDLGIEAIKQFKELGKEMLKGVTMLPKDLVVQALTGQVSETNGKPDSQKDWADEWLKDQDNKDRPPISKNVGGHSTLDTSKAFKGEEEQELAAIRQKLLGKHQSQFSRASGSSEYGQEQAKKQQEEKKPVYDQGWQERQEEAEQERRAQAAQASSIETGSIRKRGDWRGGKKKKKPRPQDLNRTEFAASKGKQ